MDKINNANPLLDLLEHPAFYVRDGIVVQVNEAARQRNIEIGQTIAQMIDRDLYAYQDFHSGCLYLTTVITGISYGAAVTRMDDCDLFLLDQPGQPERQALALAAQQLRQPLNTVFTVADELENTKQASQINRGLNQLHRIICNMADCTRYDSCSVSGAETTELCSFFAEIMEKATALLSDVNIHLHYTALPQTIIGLVNREMLERAIYNLLSNATKFSAPGGIIEAKLVRNENLLYFTLQDQGEGIPPELRSSVFFRYLREPGIEDCRHGVGLGMALVRSVASSHGGTVLIDQPETGGTRITMTLSLTADTDSSFRSPVRIPSADYAGGHDHALLELSDVLPASAYKKR